jgi:GNAT superfamily N-acetyltransferase
MRIRIGQAGVNDFDALRAIEMASFETLRSVDAVTGDAAASSDEELLHYLNDRLLFAAFDEKHVPVGYGGAYIDENMLHIGELDVHPEWQRRGIGRMLATTLLEEGRARKLKGSTLTTDRLAPFNAPFYASLGFRILESDVCPQRLQHILAEEHAKGLDPGRRVAMQLVF